LEGNLKDTNRAAAVVVDTRAGFNRVCVCSDSKNVLRVTTFGLSDDIISDIVSASSIVTEK